MARFKRTLIAEQNRELAIEIRELLDGYTDDVEVCFDGHSAIELLKSFKPDLILVEAVLPNADGFSVLEEAYYHDAVKILLSWFINGMITRKANELKADYMFIKPYPKCFAQRIIEAADSRSNDFRYKDFFMSEDNRIRDKIRNYLKALGMKSKIIGFNYIVEALIIMGRDKSAIKSLKYNVYKRIADAYDTNINCVERNIRFAIENVLQNGHITALVNLFGDIIDEHGRKPTNREFLTTVMHVLYNGEDIK